MFWLFHSGRSKAFGTLIQSLDSETYVLSHSWKFRTVQIRPSMESVIVKYSSPLPLYICLLDFWMNEYQFHQWPYKASRKLLNKETTLHMIFEV